MIILIFVVGGLLVFAIAAALVGTTSYKLGHEPTTAVIDLEEAVYETSLHLPDFASARLSYDEVRALITFELEHLREKGLAAMSGEQLDFSDRPPEVLADDDAVAYVLGRCEEEGLEVEDEDVFEVIRGLLAHLGQVGAIGRALPALEPPESGPPGD